MSCSYHGAEGQSAEGSLQLTGGLEMERDGTKKKCSRSTRATTKRNNTKNTTSTTKTAATETVSSTIAPHVGPEITAGPNWKPAANEMSAEQNIGSRVIIISMKSTTI